MFFASSGTPLAMTGRLTHAVPKLSTKEAAATLMPIVVSAILTARFHLEHSFRYACRCAYFCHSACTARSSMSCTMPA